MNIGCSECVCIAIESHRTELLRALLERPDIEYRDIYWSTLPTLSETLYRMRKPRVFDRESMIIELHSIEKDTDLSFVGREDCGHIRFDIELCAPFPHTYLLKAAVGCTSYLLVSLIKLAEWHSSDDFPAAQMLHESGKFEMNAPQFFHYSYLFKTNDNVRTEFGKYPQSVVVDSLFRGRCKSATNGFWNMSLLLRCCGIFQE